MVDGESPIIPRVEVVEPSFPFHLSLSKESTARS